MVDNNLIHVIRSIFVPAKDNKEGGSGGSMYLGSDTVRFCHTQEDESRGENVKIHGVTCMPTGRFKWVVSYSSRFKRDMIMIYTENNMYEFMSKGISFKGLRCHGGNKAENSLGCILTAYNRLNDTTIQGTAEKELTAWAKSVGGSGEIIITNQPR